MRSYEYILDIDKHDIDFINKIVEAYEGLAIVRTLDSKNGKIKILTNEYMKNDVDLLLEKFRKNGIEFNIISQDFWKGVLWTKNIIKK